MADTEDMNATTDMTDTATLRAFEAFFGSHLAAIVNVHRHKPWERAREDLFMAVKALNTVLRKAAKIKGQKDLSLSLVSQAVLPKEKEKEIENFSLELALNGDTKLHLDQFILNVSGAYPITYLIPETTAINLGEPPRISLWTPKDLDNQEALVKRIWSHFEDPKCDLVKLLSDKYWP